MKKKLSRNTNYTKMRSRIHFFKLLMENYLFNIRYFQSTNVSENNEYTASDPKIKDT